MKRSLRFLSMLVVLMTTAMTAWAADWTVKIKTVALTLNDTVYMRNVATGRYFSGGEAWGTQVVVSPLSGAAQVCIEQFEDGTYQIKNNAQGWKHSQFATNHKMNSAWRQPKDGSMGQGVKGCFVDWSTGWIEKDAKWAIEDVGGNVYRFSIPNTEAYQLTEESSAADSLLGHIDGQYLGVNRNHDSKFKGEGITWGLYYDCVYADSAENCQFEFLPVAITDAKAKLLTLVEQASGAGIDVTAGAALLADENATVEAVKAEAERLSDAIENAASPSNPQDLTAKYIANATPIQTNPEGWTVTNMQGKAVTVPASSDGVAEFWNNKGYTLKTTINQLPAGVYRFTAVALTRTGMHGKFFVNNDTIEIDTVSSGTVNNRKQAANWFKEDADEDGVLNGHSLISIVLSEPTDVTIGLMSDTTTSDYWTVWREFKLESLGKSLETFQYVNNDVLKQATAIEENEENKFTGSLMEEVKALATAGAEATDKDASADKYAAAKAKLDELKLNVKLWKKLEDAIDKADEAQWQLSNVEKLSEVVAEAQEFFNALEGNNEEIQAMIVKVNDALDYAIKTSYGPGDDVTNLITNPTFNDETKENNKTQPQSKEGWKGATFGTGGNADSRLCEQWQSDFNTYQDITGLQPGAYKLNIQAVMRPASAAESWKNYQDGKKDVYAWIYMGAQKQMVHNIFDWSWTEAQDDQESWETVEDGVVVPNTMATFYTVMDADAEVYNNSVVGLVTKNSGTMRIGIMAKDPNQTANRWMVFRDFTMEYLGNDAGNVKPVVETKANEYKSIEDAMSANEKALMNKAVAAADEAVAAGDVDAMLKAYDDMAALGDTIDASINAYKALQSSLDSLKAESQDGSMADAIAKANALIAEVTAAIENGSIAILDVPAKQKEMKDARKGLWVREGSDAAPADYTAWIQNPTFAAKAGWKTKNTEGDGNTFAISQNCGEIWNAKSTVYQTIEGLPEGTYQVKVKTFFRQIGPKKAWEQFINDTIENVSRVKLFANMDTIAPYMWATREYKDEFSATGSNWVEAIDSTNTDSLHYYLPNTLANARVVFDANCYQKEFFTYVNNTGILQIGFANNELRSADWLVTSDWELWYYGKNSEHATATGITSVGTDEKVRFDEIYTIDGRRVNTLQKGINILRGKSASGKVVTKKVIVNK